ncbi:MAG: toprim domain-containing protein [Fibrobacteres bacterium]|nr:toprim domain-containing protein [Fibrobacterota bacterium]
MRSESSAERRVRPPLAVIRERVPILLLAEHLGLPVVRNRAKCVRSENHAHGDRTPSMSLDPARNSFKCWVCPEVKGSVLDLVMQVKGLSLTEAADYLAVEFNSEIASDTLSITKSAPSSSVKQPVSGQIHIENKPFFDPALRTQILIELLKLTSSPDREALQYLKGRRISAKTASVMKLCSVSDYKAVSDALSAKFSKEQLIESGLFNEKGNLRFYQHKLLFPYYQNGIPVYLQARALDNTIVPKELNLRGAIPCPYNHDQLIRSPIIYLCEGVIDALTVIEHGFPAIAIPGAGSFKNEWLSLFKGKRVYSLLDADIAGKAANERLKALFSTAEIDFSILPIPEGFDINDYFLGKTWKK